MLGDELNATWGGSRMLLEAAPELTWQARAQRSTTVGVDVDAVAGRQIQVSWAAFEKERLEAG